MTPELGFCSHCGTRLLPAAIDGGNHASCPACGRVQWRNPEPVAGMLVTAGDSVLLARQGSPKGSATLFALPTKRIELGETAETAAVSAVRETCGLEAGVTGIVGRPHSSADTATVAISFRGELESPGSLPRISLTSIGMRRSAIPWARTEPQRGGPCAPGGRGHWNDHQPILTRMTLA